MSEYIPWVIFRKDIIFLKDIGKEVFTIKYPNWLKKVNHVLALTAGFIALAVGIMLVVQVILLYIFKSPTSWITDYCAYAICLMLFIAGGNTYQIHAHVGVDLLRNFIDKKTNKAHNRLPVRILATESLLSFYEVADHISLFPEADQVGCVVMCQSAWDRLDEAQQA